MSPSSKQVKQLGEYSTNPNTIRARKRKERLPPLERMKEQARANDWKAVTRAWKLRTETDTYKMASPEDQKTMLDQTREGVMQSRHDKGIDYDSKLNDFITQHSQPGNNNHPLSPAGHSTMPSIESSAALSPAAATENAANYADPLGLGLNTSGNLDHEHLASFSHPFDSNRPVGRGNDMGQSCMPHANSHQFISSPPFPQWAINTHPVQPILGAQQTSGGRSSGTIPSLEQVPLCSNSSLADNAFRFHLIKCHEKIGALETELMECRRRIDILERRNADTDRGFHRHAETAPVVVQAFTGAPAETEARPGASNHGASADIGQNVEHADNHEDGHSIEWLNQYVEFE